MRIVITGATGYVGRHLVSLLQKGDNDLLLVGRDKTKIKNLFPGCRCCDYAELVREAQGYTTLLHLAVVNNNSSEPLETFLNVNVKGALETAGLARKAGIAKFLNVSSTHALDPTNTSSYAVSKKQAAAELEELEGIEVVSIYLPYVYDPHFSDRLSFLKKLPFPLSRLLFHAVASRKPTVSVNRIAGFVQTIETQGLSDTLPIPIIISDGQAGNPVFAVFKRTLDLVFALAVAVFFWWLLILIWALVRIDSRGPGISAQERVGQNGRSFTSYKFRTEKTGAGSTETSEACARSTTMLGLVLRKSKLDELPQIINLLRNEISLVGPRAGQPEQRELIDARRQLGVLALKPGFSGLAQVNGVDMNDPEKLAQWDARYMALQSLRLDLKIIIATALGSGNGDRVAK